MGGLEDDITIIKSLIAISRGGLSLEKIPREFREMNGSPLDFRKYGFKSLEEMLRSSRDIVLRQSHDGCICHVNDEKMSHVTSLVNRTRDQSLRKRTRKRAFKTFNRGFNSQQQYGYRTGGPSSPFRDRQRLPFQPVNGMKQQRSNNRFMAPARAPVKAQMYSKSYFDSEQSARPVQSGMGKSGNGKQFNQEYHREPQGNYRYQPQNSLSINSNSDFKDLGRYKTEDLKSKPIQSSSIGSTVINSVKTKVKSDSDWSSDSSDDVQHSKINLSFISSDSEWSSDSSVDAAPFSAQGSEQNVRSSGSNRAAIPQQNGPVSSTNKLKPEQKQSEHTKPTGQRIIVTLRSEMEDKVPKGNSNRCSDKQTKLNCTPLLECSPPLMAGGIGRGRLRSRTGSQNPGGLVARPQQTVNLNPCPAKEGTTITGSPCKRETLTTSKNGLSTIVVNVSNEVPLVCAQNPKVCAEPSCNGFQFIGDNFLLRVADVSLGSKVLKHGSVTYCGLCRSNLTITECEKEIRKKKPLKNIVIMIGMTDILQGASLEEMKERTSSLLTALKDHCLVLLALPVPPSFITAGNENKLTVLEKYNKWLLSLPLPTVIDIEQHLYCDKPFYMRQSDSVETFSEEGCWVVMDEILGKIC